MWLRRPVQFLHHTYPAPHRPPLRAAPHQLLALRIHGIYFTLGFAREPDNTLVSDGSSYRSI